VRVCYVVSRSMTLCSHPKSCCLLHVQAMGSETGIVLIHGYGGGAFSWRHVLGPLARSTACRVIAFDRPAFGALRVLLLRTRWTSRAATRSVTLLCLLQHGLTQKYRLCRTDFSATAAVERVTAGQPIQRTLPDRPDAGALQSSGSAAGALRGTRRWRPAGTPHDSRGSRPAQQAAWRSTSWRIHAPCCELCSMAVARAADSGATVVSQPVGAVRPYWHGGITDEPAAPNALGRERLYRCTAATAWLAAAVRARVVAIRAVHAGLAQQRCKY